MLLEDFIKRESLDKTKYYKKKMKDLADGTILCWRFDA